MNQNTWKLFFVRILLGASSIAAPFAMVASAGDTIYTYDALGRLTTVTRPDGTVTTYSLDAAGNRTQVSEASGPAPGIPPSSTVPATNSTGSYTISWAQSTGSVSEYELYEAANASFSPQTTAHSGIATSKLITGKTSGSYYYRVRACNGGNCSGYQTGLNPVAVSVMPPAVVPPLRYWQSSQCSWYAEWPASAGATSYTVRDWSGQFQPSVSTNNATYSFCGSPNYSGNPNDYRPKWVKACGGSACSAQTNFP